MRNKITREYLEPRGYDPNEVACILSKDPNKIFFEEYSYKQQRGDFKKIIAEIFIANDKEYESEEDVFAVFVRAALSGELLPVARLIEKTFGKGSFRKLGEGKK